MIPAFIYANECTEPQPVIISIHGGPESQSRPFSQRVQLWSKRLGAAVITPNVRGSDGYGKNYLGLDNGFREDSVKDIGALLDWIEVQPCLDSDRVAGLEDLTVATWFLRVPRIILIALELRLILLAFPTFVTFLENAEDYRRDLRRVEYGDERDLK